MRKSGIDRSKIFYTSKIPVSHMGYEKAKEALAASFADAKLDYIDLYVSWPTSRIILKGYDVG